MRQRRGARRRVLPSCTNCRAPRLRSTSFASLSFLVPLLLPFPSFFFLLCSFTISLSPLLFLFLTHAHAHTLRLSFSPRLSFQMSELWNVRWMVPMCEIDRAAKFNVVPNDSAIKGRQSNCRRYYFATDYEITFFSSFFLSNNYSKSSPKGRAKFVR